MRGQYKQDKGRGTINIWKVIAILFIALFAATLVFSLVKLQRFKQTLADPTDAQLESVRSIVLQDLEGRGFNISDCSVKVAPKIRGMEEAGTDRNIIQVFAISNSSRHNYLIDMDSDMILLHSQTETFGWMADMDKRMMMPMRPERDKAGCMEKHNGSEKDCERESPGRVPRFPMRISDRD